MRAADDFLPLYEEQAAIEALREADAIFIPEGQVTEQVLECAQPALRQRDLNLKHDMAGCKVGPRVVRCRFATAMLSRDPIYCRGTGDRMSGLSLFDTRWN